MYHVLNWLQCSDWRNDILSTVSAAMAAKINRFWISSVLRISANEIGTLSCLFVFSCLIFFFNLILTLLLFNSFLVAFFFFLFSFPHFSTYWLPIACLLAFLLELFALSQPCISTIVFQDHEVENSGTAKRSTCIVLACFPCGTLIFSIYTVSACFISRIFIYYKSIILVFILLSVLSFFLHYFYLFLFHSQPNAVTQWYNRWIHVANLSRYPS